MILVAFSSNLWGTFWRFGAMGNHIAIFRGELRCYIAGVSQALDRLQWLQYSYTIEST